MLYTLKPALLAGLMGLSSALASAGLAQQVDDVQIGTPDTATAAEQTTIPIQEKTPAPAQHWQLHKGVPVHAQLQAWAERSGWTLHWQPKVSWLVAGDVEWIGSFEDALKEVVEGLFFEGKPIRLVLWEGNRLAEVLPSDVR